jgi:hypothetical protein
MAVLNHYATDLSQTRGKELIDKLSDDIEIFNAHLVPP